MGKRAAILLAGVILCLWGIGFCVAEHKAEQNAVPSENIKPEPIKPESVPPESAVVKPEPVPLESQLATVEVKVTDFVGVREVEFFSLDQEVRRKAWSFADRNTVASSKPKVSAWTLEFLFITGLLYPGVDFTGCY